MKKVIINLINAKIILVYLNVKPNYSKSNHLEHI